MPDKSKSYRLYIDTGDGWVETEAEQDGSYLVFTAQGSSFRAALAQEASTAPILITTAAAAAAVLIVVLLLVKKRKKSKKKAAVK